jgi:hypothetical protein
MTTLVSICVHGTLFAMVFLAGWALVDLINPKRPPCNCGGQPPCPACRTTVFGKAWFLIRRLLRKASSWWVYPGIVFHDKDHRIIIELRGARLQLWSFFIEKHWAYARTIEKAPDGTRDRFIDTKYAEWRAGINPKWRELQPKKKHCLKCQRWCQSPCELKEADGTEYRDGYYMDGPWDSFCHDVYHPENKQ